MNSAGAGAASSPVSTAASRPLVEPGPDLTADEKRRYARQLLLPSVGVEGQRRLKNARALCIGAGGLGSPAMLYLAAAGVGTIGVIDDDRVDESNLQRQVIHASEAVGKLKVESAADRIGELNPLVRVETHPVRLTPANALEILGRYDLVLDGADNFPTRYLVADAAEILGMPVIWGSLLREQGQLSVFWSGVGPTYRDLFPAMPNPDDVPTCAAAGVIGATCALIGSSMANEAVKLVTGAGRSLVGRLQIYDALQASWRELTLRVDPNRQPVTTLAESYEFGCGAAESVAEWQPVELADALAARTRGERTFTLLDVRTQAERDIDALPGSDHLTVDEVIADPAQLSVDSSYVVYCQSGVRSERAALAMQNHGLDVTHLAGGLTEFRKRFPTMPGDETSAQQPQGRC